MCMYIHVKERYRGQFPTDTISFGVSANLQFSLSVSLPASVANPSSHFLSFALPSALGLHAPS